MSAARRLLLGFAVVTSAIAFGSQADAEEEVSNEPTVAVNAATPAPPSNAASAKLVARGWFDRGLVLYNSKDYAGALAEFQRAFDLVPHPVVLLNIVLTYAHLDNPVDCVQSADRLFAMDTSRLDATALRALQLVYAEQKARIAELAIKSNVPGVAIQVDGIDVGKAPLQRVQVPAGDHVLSATATGHIPRRLRIRLLPQSQQDVDIQLQPLERSLAHLQILSKTPDAEVWVDGELCGRSPLPASLAFSPGQHEIELRRLGYQSVKRAVHLDPGSSGSLEFSLARDPNSEATHLGTLTLQYEEVNSLVVIDGEPQTFGARRFELPRGTHRIEVKHEGFVPYALDVELVTPETRVDIRLQPTPGWLDEYVHGARLQRNWAIAGMVGGGALIAGGVALLGWNVGPKRAAKRQFDAFAEEVRQSPQGQCGDPACDMELERLGDRVTSTRARDLIGWIGAGVGAAVLGTGVGAYLLGDEPERYAPSPGSDVFSSLRVHVWPTHAALAGAF